MDEKHYGVNYIILYKFTSYGTRPYMSPDSYTKPVMHLGVITEDNIFNRHPIYTFVKVNLKKMAFGHFSKILVFLTIFQRVQVINK